MHIGIVYHLENRIADFKNVALVWSCDQQAGLHSFIFVGDNTNKGAGQNHPYYLPCVHIWIAVYFEIKILLLLLIEFCKKNPELFTD